MDANSAQSDLAFIRSVLQPIGLGKLSQPAPLGAPLVNQGACSSFSERPVTLVTGREVRGGESTDDACIDVGINRFVELGDAQCATPCVIEPIVRVDVHVAIQLRTNILLVGVKRAVGR